jgi:hypothetical protein
MMLMDSPLKKEFEFYKANQDSLVAKYDGKFVVIKDQEIKGVYDTEMEAYKMGQKSFPLGSFLIQLVEKGEGSYSQTFYSRVAI